MTESWENDVRIFVAVYSGRNAQPGHVVMVKGMHFPFANFFCASFYVRKKLLKKTSNFLLKYKNDVAVFKFLIISFCLDERKTIFYKLFLYFCETDAQNVITFAKIKDKHLKACIFPTR